jgi:nicotinamidase-related amidase
MSAKPLRLPADQSVLLVVDVQDKLLALIPDAALTVINISFLLDAAKALSVPILATEQYPKGLGPTTGSIAERLASPIPTKTAFSCCGAAGFEDELARQGRNTVVVVGIETHVCVLQTALDLLERGFHVAVPADAVAARGAIDHDWALHRLDHAGAILTTSEATAFEWVGDSTAPAFKTISALVQDRYRQLRGRGAVTGRGAGGRAEDQRD